MTTNVSFFAPYICADKALHVKVYPPGKPDQPTSEMNVTEANKVHTLVIHDHALIEISEINASSIEPPTGPTEE